MKALPLDISIRSQRVKSRGPKLSHGKYTDMGINCTGNMSINYGVQYKYHVVEVVNKQFDFTNL